MFDPFFLEGRLAHVFRWHNNSEDTEGVGGWCVCVRLCVVVVMVGVTAGG